VRAGAFVRLGYSQVPGWGGRLQGLPASAVVRLAQVGVAAVRWPLLAVGVTASGRYGWGLAVGVTATGWLLGVTATGWLPGVTATGWLPGVTATGWLPGVTATGWLPGITRVRWLLLPMGSRHLWAAPGRRLRLYPYRGTSRAAGCWLHLSRR